MGKFLVKLVCSILSGLELGHFLGNYAALCTLDCVQKLGQIALAISGLLFGSAKSGKPSLNPCEAACSVQACITMEATGESIAAEAFKSPQGAGLETGGAHWFATAPEETANADTTSTANIDGKLHIQVWNTPTSMW
jgi:hypothetical protein